MGAAAVYYGLAAAAAIGGAYATHESAKAAQYEYKARADEEKMSARDREIARRDKLLKALAQRNVAAAAGGTSLEGTPVALAMSDLNQYSLESLSSEAMTAARVSSLNAAGKNVRRIARINIAADLAGAASSMMGGMGAGKGAAGKATKTGNSGYSPTRGPI